MTTITSYATDVRFERSDAISLYVYDAASGRCTGYVQIMRGFAHFEGQKRTAHEGVRAVVGGGIDGLTRALASGLKSGRDDRANGV